MPNCFQTTCQSPAAVKDHLPSVVVLGLDELKQQVPIEGVKRGMEEHPEERLRHHVAGRLSFPFLCDLRLTDTPAALLFLAGDRFLPLGLLGPF